MMNLLFKIGCAVVAVSFLCLAILYNRLSVFAFFVLSAICVVGAALMTAGTVGPLISDLRDRLS